MKKILTFTAILAVILIALGVWYYQKNSYPKESLRLEVIGPEKAEVGEEVEYTIRYKNNGEIKLENPRLVFELPENTVFTFESTAFSGDSSRKEKELEDILPGEEKTFTIKARVLGKEGDTLTAKAWLNYQPKNLKVRYESATTSTSSISTVPLTFEFDIPSRLGTGNEIVFRINYFSNISYPLSDLRIQTEYPGDFEFVKSTPKGLENNEWEIPLLNTGDGGRIEVTGKLLGQVGEDKRFGGKIGIWKDGKFIVLKEVVKNIAMVEPSLYISQQINGNPEYTANFGDQLHYQIFFKNIGDKALSNLFLICKFDSQLLDFSSFKSDSGKYETGDNSIVFDYRNTSQLQLLDAGEEGEIEFWVDVKDLPDSVRNPVIKNKIILNQAQKEFVTKVNSKLELSQKVFYQDEVFGNSGPVTPRVGEITTYTVVWQVKNYSSDVKNVRVKATIPPEVRLTGNIFPEDQKAKFAFDFQSREIVWELGDLSTASDSSLSIAFQIALAPNAQQVGQLATLLSESHISGEDSWSGGIAKTDLSRVDSSLPDDPSVDENSGRVQ